MNPYETADLQEALQSLQRPPRFLLDFFFNTTVLSDTKQICFDFEEDDLTLAPFVSPLVAGKAQRAQGSQTKFFTPAYVKPKNIVDPAAPLTRLPGEALGGTLSASDRRDRTINKLMNLQRDKIIRRMEAMAAEFFRTGKIIVEGDDYPRVEVDFGRANGHQDNLAGAARWGENGVSPFDDIDSWSDTVATAIGAGVDTVVMGKSAWQLFRADPKTEKALDRTKGQNSLIELGYQTGEVGAPQYKGSIGDVSFYVYSGQYKDDQGAVVKMIDPHGVLSVASAAIAGRRCHGAILDGAAGYQAAEFFPKNWIENDPANEFVMTQSAPLVVPGRPNASHYRKVR